MTPDSDTGNELDATSGDRELTLLHIALRVTFMIVGAVPVMMLAVSLGAAIELITELIAGDDSYYQNHGWCQVLACMVAGTVCFALRRLPYLESGRWIGPLVIAIGIYLLFQ